MSEIGKITTFDFGKTYYRICQSSKYSDSLVLQNIETGGFRCYYSGVTCTYTEGTIYFHCRLAILTELAKLRIQNDT